MFDCKKYIGVFGLLLLGATAYGQVPPTNDTSDANQNTGMGTGALQSNTTGSLNTASGDSALISNTTGDGNTASGVGALLNNTTGPNNTAVGEITLYNNTTGFTNSAVGGYALFTNTTGAQNTAVGGGALYSNTTGNNNVGVGVGAGGGITEGGQNVAIGLNAGPNITTGNYNIVIGTYAGSNLTTGNANIDIGNDGVAGERHTIRIGNAGQHTAAYMAGIWGHIVKPGSPVFVGPDGSLGVVASSERYKTDIVSMGSNTLKISQLRPVTFHLKSDATGELQYGLIAEEVDKVFPELVVRDEAGKIEGVRYDELAPLLLNEMQKQAAEIRDLKQQLADIQTSLVRLESKDQLVAQR